MRSPSVRISLLEGFAKESGAGSSCELSAKKASRAATEGSFLEKKLKELKRRLKDIKNNKPRGLRRALGDRGLRDDEEPVAARSRGSGRKRHDVPPPTSDRVELRVHTPSGRSVKVSRLLAERADGEELARPTDLHDTRHRERGRSCRPRDRSRNR
jgi:hypothetical protein